MKERGELVTRSLSHVNSAPMQNFSSSFLIFFYQTALGGLLALSVTPFQELERGFYKSTGGILFVMALLGLWGKSSLYWQAITEHFTLTRFAEVFFHLGFVISFACYMVSLWGEKQRFRARSFSSSILLGLAGLVLSAHNFYIAPTFSLETIAYPMSFLLSALLLGSVTVGMLIGHWYLIDTGQSLNPFIRVYKFFVVVLIAQSVFLCLSSTGTLFFRIGPYRRRHGTTLAKSLHIADYADLSWPGSTADFILDDLAHFAHTTHHGRYGTLLYCAARCFCWRDFGKADSRSNFPALLNSTARLGLKI